MNLEKIAAAGQSCGGAQVMAIAHDPRLRTYLMFNSGMGDLSMADATKDSVQKVHGPVLYLIGGPDDVAYPNAELDYARIDHLPVAVANLEVGHGGTFAGEHGGAFARPTPAWLDWQLKGRPETATIFTEGKPTAQPGRDVKAKQF